MFEPATAQRMAEMALEPVASTPEAFTRLAESAIPRWRAVVQARGIQAMQVTLATPCCACFARGSMRLKWGR